MLCSRDRSALRSSQGRFSNPSQQILGNVSNDRRKRVRSACSQRRSLAANEQRNTEDLLVIRSQKFRKRRQFPPSIESIEKTYFLFGGQNSFCNPLTVWIYPST